MKGDKLVVFEANSSSGLQAVFDVRKAVFVVEQQVSEKEEYDEYETSSTHLAASIDGQVVGTCRFRNTEKGIKLERFAVLEPYRKKGVGRALVQAVLATIDLSQNVYLHAQIQVVDFYTRYGFIKKGNLFEEAGIKHFEMVLKNSVST